MSMSLTSPSLVGRLLVAGTLFIAATAGCGSDGASDDGDEEVVTTSSTPLGDDGVTSSTASGGEGDGSTPAECETVTTIDEYGFEIELDDCE